MNQEELAAWAARDLQRYLKSKGLTATVTHSRAELIIHNDQKVFFMFPDYWEGFPVLLRNTWQLPPR